MVKAILSSDASVLTRIILHNVPEDGILQSYRSENLKHYSSFGVTSSHGIIGRREV
jgi:hypothetical protein